MADELLPLGIRKNSNMTANSSRLFFSALLPLLCISPEVVGQEHEVFSFDGSYRLRYESLQNGFRTGASGSDHILVSRLLLSLKANGDHLFGELEIKDARAWLDDASSPLGTDDVNTLEPIQAWVGWHQEGKYALKAGRMTLDIGSRRLLARQRFRNTMSTFDGVHGRYYQDAIQWRAFYVKPIDRYPNYPTALDNNDIKIDEQSDDKFWGLHMQHSGDTDLELYYYGLDEDADGAELTTIGFRSLKKATVHQWHYEVEAVYQTGQTGDLDVIAGMGHVHIGYQFADALSSRIEFMADYASGDDDPNDNESNRFNTLFGVDRFDLSPTSIYGAFARTNIISPGLKLNIKPTKDNAVFIAYRAVWLDSATDSQSRSNLRDTSGNSGRFAGHQVEARWRLNFSKQLLLELGGAYLKKGEFFENAPKAPDTGDTKYVYSQFIYRF